MPVFQEPKSLARYILTTLAILLFVTTMVIVILQGSIFRPITGGALRSYDQGFIDGFTQARDMALKAGLPSLLNRSVLSGSVDRVGKEALAITVKGLVVDEKVDGVGLERVVKLTPSTKFSLLKRRAPEEFSKLQQAYLQSLQNRQPTQPLPNPPSPVTETALALADIKVGDQITVMGREGEDITLELTFEAVKIQISR